MLYLLLSSISFLFSFVNHISTYHRPTPLAPPLPSPPLALTPFITGLSQSDRFWLRQGGAGSHLHAVRHARLSGAGGGQRTGKTQTQIFFGFMFPLQFQSACFVNVFSLRLISSSLSQCVQFVAFLVFCVSPHPSCNALPPLCICLYHDRISLHDFPSFAFTHAGPRQGRRLVDTGRAYL